jgi:DNA-binding NarL/FixJ family response regulator
MDIRLAGDLDGVETARRILRSAPIPIIFMTGFSDSEVVDRAKGLNPLGFLFKPIRVERIASLIESIPDRGD